MQQTVAVLGGGVAGLSAAHELAERGFAVHVYERKPVLGGKARSIDVPNSGGNGRKPLPGEHGFRFFPGFYKHVTDTMRRIPYGAHGSTFDNLSVATRFLLARAGQTELTWVARYPSNLEDFRAFLVEMLTPLGVPLDELTFFISRLLIVATSCPERRLAEYERIPWWDFIAAARMSKAYQSDLGQGLTRSLVAMRAEESSTRTVGTTQLQLLYGLISPDHVFDRLLSGPTNDVWIYPWTQHLEKLGVTFHRGARVTGIETDEAGLNKLGERIFNLQRAIRIREGWNGRQGDILRDVFYKTPIQTARFNVDCMVPGPNGEPFSRRGYVVEEEKFEKMKGEYYALRGWDGATGFQTMAGLKGLGLEDVAIDLEKRKLLK